MRSKISYFNPTLFKKNLARFWPLWGGASALGALAPLYLLVAYLNSDLKPTAGMGLEITRIYYGVLQYGVPLISLFYAALCALAVWHYLYSARSLGLYHALPITRKGLFVTNLLSGMAMMLIPYAVTGGLAILFTLFLGLFEPVGVLVTILGVLGESFFYFAAATCIIFITGNPFAYAAFYFIFHFLAFGAEYLVAKLTGLFYFGVSNSYTSMFAFLSPTFFLVTTDRLSIGTTHRQVVTDEGWVRSELESVTLTGGWVIAAYALAGVALLGCAWLLYSRRRSESAGDVVAVGWMKPVFRYGVALCAALAGGWMLYSIFCYDFIESDTARPLPMAVCMAIAGVVGYYIASMLLAKSLAVFRGSAKGALATVIASIAVCFLIAADPFGVERWVPEAPEMVGFSIYGGGSGGYLGANLTDAASIQKLLDLHRTVLAEKELLDDRDRDPELWGRGSGWLNLNYVIDGKYVSRSYRLPTSDAALERLETLKKAADLAVDPDIQEANIFENISPKRVTNARPTGGYIHTVYNTVTGNFEGVDLTAEQTRELEEAIRRDIRAGHFGRTMFVMDYEERDRLTYTGSIELHYNVTHTPEYSNYPSSVDIHLEISTYCTETMKALEDMGVLGGTYKLLTVAESDRQPRAESYSRAVDTEVYY